MDARRRATDPLASAALNLGPADASGVHLASRHSSTPSPREACPLICIDRATPVLWLPRRAGVDPASRSFAMAAAGHRAAAAVMAAAMRLAPCLRAGGSSGFTFLAAPTTTGYALALRHAQMMALPRRAQSTTPEAKRPAAAGGAPPTMPQSHSAEHCWSCGACVNKMMLFCGKCEYIQPVDSGLNYFEMLDMWVPPPQPPLAPLLPARLHGSMGH